jgi:hypothetical protein
MANRLAHSSNLAIPTLVNDDAKDPIGRLGNLGRRRQLTVEKHPLAESAKCASRYPSARDFGNVLLLDTSTGVRDPLSESSVIREQEQPLGVIVESPHRKDSRFSRNQIQHRRSSLRIIGSRHDTRWLVQQVIHEAGTNADFDSIDFDRIGLHLDSPAQFCDLSVDVHSSLSDHLFTRPPRTEAVLKALTRRQTSIRL